MVTYRGKKYAGIIEQYSNWRKETPNDKSTWYHYWERYIPTNVIPSDMFTDRMNAETSVSMVEVVAIFKVKYK